MSAITGTGESRTSFDSASASSDFGTATRTISQPAEASAAIWAVVASTSCVFVSVIDWTTTGAPPPIWTPPTVMWRSEAISVPVYCRPLAVLWLYATKPGLPPAETVDVVREADEHQHQKERDADRRDSFVDLASH